MQKMGARLLFGGLEKLGHQHALGLRRVGLLLQ